MRIPIIVPLAVFSLTAACQGCPVTPGVENDAGRATSGASSSSGGGASSSSGSIRTDGGKLDGGRGDGGGCGPDTPGFGEPCGACGAQLCGRGGGLACQDPGKNACGVCGQLELTGGIKGKACGSCGTVGCADGGLVTECQGEHPPNECGGCLEIPEGHGPADAGCSECNSGRWRCQVTQNDLTCWGGRAQNRCGGCERCIQFTAEMEDLTQGSYVRSGTVAIIEDVGSDEDMGTVPGQSMVLTFDPLVYGPGGTVMEGALVFISPTPNHDDPSAYALPEFFSAYNYGQPGDPARVYHIYFNVNPISPGYVIIYDGFLDVVVSRGRLIASH